MATKKEKTGREYRERLKNDLLGMAEVLRDHCSENCRNPDSLKTAANHLNRRGSSNLLSWKYQVVQLEFLADKPRHSQPSTLPDQIDVILDVSAEGLAGHDPHDPFTHLAVNIQLKAEIGGQEHLDTWHMDRHLTGGNTPEEIHPLYHIQRGGHRMSGLMNNIGRTMVLEPPRITHPPLDAILGIDYVLSHYAGRKWCELRTRNEYAKLVREAQKRLWSGVAWTWARHWSEPLEIFPANSLDLSPSLYAH